MKERGILFQGDMVRAIQRKVGPKKQTRRFVTPPPPHDPLHRGIDFEGADAIWWAGNHTQGIYHRATSPYGVPGDRLWVREAWRMGKNLDALPGSEIEPGKRGRIAYEADAADEAPWPNRGRYRHARFMPRWACRLVLEVTEVRAQRLQDITDDDAVAEGARDKMDYALLWARINGPDSWNANPFVWAVSFELLPNLSWRERLAQQQQL